MTIKLQQPLAEVSRINRTIFCPNAAPQPAATSPPPSLSQPGKTAATRADRKEKRWCAPNRERTEMFDNAKIGVRYSSNDAARLFHTCCNRGRRGRGGLDELASKDQSNGAGDREKFRPRKMGATLSGRVYLCFRALFTSPHFRGVSRTLTRFLLDSETENQAQTTQKPLIICPCSLEYH